MQDASRADPANSCRRRQVSQAYVNDQPRRCRSFDPGGAAGALCGGGRNVTNDSGPAHFATASGLPTIVLFRPETPRLISLSAVRRRSMGDLPSVGPRREGRARCVQAFPPSRRLDARRSAKPRVSHLNPTRGPTPPLAPQQRDIWLSGRTCELATTRRAVGEAA